MIYILVAAVWGFGYLACRVISKRITAKHFEPINRYRELYANEHESLDERSLDAWNHELDYCDICRSKSLAWKNFGPGRFVAGASITTGTITTDNIQAARAHDLVDITSDESHVPIKTYCMTCDTYGSIHTHGRGASSDPQIICS